MGLPSRWARELYLFSHEVQTQPLPFRNIDPLGAPAYLAQTRKELRRAHSAAHGSAFCGGVSMTDLITRCFLFLQEDREAPRPADMDDGQNRPYARLRFPTLSHNRYDRHRSCAPGVRSASRHGNRPGPMPWLLRASLLASSGSGLADQHATLTQIAILVSTLLSHLPVLSLLPVSWLAMQQ